MDGRQKHLATLIAKLALRGYAVHELAAGGFVVCRPNFARLCADLDALRAVAQMVGLCRD